VVDVYEGRLATGNLMFVMCLVFIVLYVLCAKLEKRPRSGSK